MEPFNPSIFIGRFHPLIVHLPIGFLTLSFLLLLIKTIKKHEYKSLALAIRLSVLLAAISGLVAAIVGYMLSSEGGYQADSLDWHQWMAYAIVATSFILWALLKFYHFFSDQGALWFHSFVMLLLVATGHLGGNLTHGSEYLIEYAPDGVKKLFSTAAARIEIPQNPDSIVIYEHIIQPILKNKCYSCHNAEKKKGNLDLTSLEGALPGEGSNSIINPGNAFQSSLFKRVTLNPDNSKFMPPNGLPLSYGEIELLKWWIEQGASFDQTMADAETNAYLGAKLLKEFEIDISPKEYYELVQIAPLAPEDFEAMSKLGIRARPLSIDVNFLDVSINSSGITSGQVEAILKYSDHITWLDLSNKKITDEHLQDIAKLSNLTKLNISNNPITDEGAGHLRGLKHLKVLNMHSTGVGDDVILFLSEMASLNTCILWNTKVTREERNTTEDKTAIEWIL